MVRRAIPGVVVLLALVAVSCAGGDDGSAGSSTTTTKATTTTTTAGTTTSSGQATTSTVTTTTGATRGPTTRCANTQAWGTAPRTADTMSTEDLYLVRAGQHDCYDRIVFDVNGVVAGPQVVGFDVQYLSGDATLDPSGKPIPTAGDATLQVGVRAPALGYGMTGHQPGRVLAREGDDLISADQLRSWGALREVRFAGSFEGQSSFAVGVVAELPFRVGAYERDGYTHVYVDIAHPA